MRSLSPEEREALLVARESVWRAWFAGDRAQLAALLPDETITIDPNEEQWADRAEVFDRARRFAAGGAKLIDLSFPDTRMQAYGNVVMVYTTYRLTIERDGGCTVHRGRATEVFVKRSGCWLNAGWHLDAGPVDSGGTSGAADGGNTP